MDDRDVVLAMAGRDPAGLEPAYRRYAARLHAYCRRMLGGGDEAADAVHDTFVLASQRIDQLREPERLRAWLYAIARSECLRLLRARGRRAPLTALSGADEPADDGADPVAGLHADRVRELVHAAAGGLSDGDREVIELALRHGLTPTEVGTVLGMAPNHAHARWVTKCHLSKLEWPQFRTDQINAGRIVVDVDQYAWGDGTAFAAMAIENDENLSWTTATDMTLAGFNAFTNARYNDAYRLLGAESVLSPTGGQRFTGLFVRNVNGRGAPAQGQLTAAQYGDWWDDLGDDFRVINQERYETAAGTRYLGVWRQNN